LRERRMKMTLRKNLKSKNAKKTKKSVASGSVAKAPSREGRLIVYGANRTGRSGADGFG